MRSRIFCLTIFTVLAAAPFAAAQGSLHGHARFDKIKGDTSKGYVELYEYKAFLTPLGTGTGYSYHVGDPGTAAHPNTGCVTFNGIAPGGYTMLTVWGEFFPRGRVVQNITVNNGAQTDADADQPIDYSGYFDKGDWDPSGAPSVIQTFTATGTSIVRASFAKADSNQDGQVRFSIHRDNGGAIETWPQVGPARTVNRQGYGGDHWAGWHAGDVATTPGVRHALKLTAVGGPHIQPYWCDDAFFPGGAGYRGQQSSPANHDYYMAVFSDADGTMSTITVPSSSNALAGWYDRWAQSYTARGGSLAGAAATITTGGSSGWNFSVNVSVHQDTPDGPRIGPTKTMPCAYAPFRGIAGVAFGKDEVPTEVGRTYWVVYERQGGGGFNAYRQSEPDAYGAGTASYFDGAWHQQSFDLRISLFEYAEPRQESSAARIALDSD